MIPTILIVDDDPTMLKLYSRIFAGQAYDVTLAAGFAEAAALIGAGQYTLLVTDLKLGDGLGTDLALLFAKKFPGAMILLVTGSHLAAEDLDLSAISECLVKPLDIVRFIDIVTKKLPRPDKTECCAPA